MLQTLLAQVREFKKPSLITPVFVILEVIMEIIIPYLMASIIDIGVNQGSIQNVCLVGLCMLAAAMLSLIFGMLAGKYAARASTGFSRNLRKAMFDNIQNYSFSNIDKFSTAGLVTRLTTDVTNVQNAYQMILRLCIRAPFMLICAMFMASRISVSLSGIFWGAILFLGIALFLITSHVHPLFMKVFQKYDDLNSSVQENVGAIRVVKAYVREDYEVSKFKKASGNIYSMFIKAERLLVFNTPLMQFAMYACILLISWLGAQMIVSDSLTTGQLMSLFTYVMNILMSLMMISMIFVMITMAKASAERIAEVIEEQPDILNPARAVREVKDGTVEFDHVNFKYKADGENNVLEDICLTIGSGETVGIIGGTGSAKSTLVQLIPRLYDVKDGSVRVGGVDVREYDLETLRDEVAMVLQKNVLFSGTIEENLRWGKKDASREDMERACRLVQADEFIRTLPEGYGTYIEQGGTNVSGGQKQRLCIARALLKKPRILILDDSTSAVDTRTDALIRQAFREEIPDTTKIIIAQRISSVQDADIIIVLNEGRVEGVGTHEELLKSSPIYRDVYESQTTKSQSTEEGDAAHE